MHFTGRIFFNFDTYDVWRIYTILVKASQSKGVSVDVEWRPFLTTDRHGDVAVASKTKGLAACELVRGEFPELYGRFAGALLTMAYQEKDDPGADKTLAVAAHVAGIDGKDVVGRAVDPGVGLLEEATEAARDRGVSDVPTIERQGPPVYIKTTGAANYGDSVGRLELINRMLNEDGIWVMKKP